MASLASSGGDSSSGGGSYFGGAGGYMGILGSAMNAYGGGSGENDRENAMIERENGIREATRIRREGSKHLGVMHTTSAKSGFRPTGSIMEEIYRVAGDIEENAQNALRKGNQSAWAYDKRAKNAKKQANLKMFSSVMSSFR